MYKRQVQNVTQRSFVDEEVEALQTVAMVLSEMLTASGEAQAEPALPPEAPRQFSGIGLTDGMAMGHIVLHEPRIEVTKLISDDPDEEMRRLEAAIYDLRRNVDRMLTTDDVSHAGEHLAVLEAYRMFANDRGWLRRMQDAVRTGLTAEAAVESVNNCLLYTSPSPRD